MHSRFLNQLFSTGVIQVDPPDKHPAHHDEEWLPVLQQAEELHRSALPGKAPPWLAAVSLWAAKWLYGACQCLTYREIDAVGVQRLLGTLPPLNGTPEACYSADVVFRCLPDLLHQSKRAAPEDQLTMSLLAMAKSWPLSSVGIGALGPLDLSGFIDDPCLRRAYADRILLRNDVSRLDDERVRTEIRKILGGHPELATEVASHLEGKDIKE